MSIILIKTHSHPRANQFDSNREAVIKHVLNTDVGRICVGGDLDMSRKAVTMAEK